MKGFLLTTLLVLSLCSCIGIQSQLSLGRDGSGTLRLDYRLARFLKEGVDLPLPVSRSDFQRAVEAAPGLKLETLSEREDEQDLYIAARLSFDRLDDLNALGSQLGLSYTVQEDSHTFRQRVYAGQPSEGISAESLKMIDAFFQGYELSFELNSPAPIKAHTLGELSADRRSLRYKTTVAELLKHKDEVALEASW
jgi:hypothetical protein